MSWRFSKAAEEWGDYKAEIRRSLDRRNSWRDAGHVFVDIFVEAFRRMPYTIGHVAAVLVLIGALWLFL